MIGKFIRMLTARFTLPQVLPTRVFGDNKANEDMANGGMITHSRFVAQKVAYNQREVRKGNFIFNHVPDEDNAADSRLHGEVGLAEKTSQDYSIYL